MTDICSLPLLDLRVFWPSLAHPTPPTDASLNLMQGYLNAATKTLHIKTYGGVVTIPLPPVAGVSLTMPGEFNVTGSGSDTLGVDWVDQNINLIFASPSVGDPGSPLFRAMVTNDIPNGIISLVKLADGTPGKAVGFDEDGHPGEIGAPEHNHTDDDSGGLLTGAAFGPVDPGEFMIGPIDPGGSPDEPSFRPLQSTDFLDVIEIRNFNENSFIATNGDPTVTSDEDNGYYIGSRIINKLTKTDWVCVDNTTGAAVWKITTQNGMSAVWTRHITPGNTTFAIPAGAKLIRVICIGAGGGGGSGRQGLINTQKCGGGGGAGGYCVEEWFDAAELSALSPVPLRVGAGGTGAAQSSGSGTNGTAGGDSFFGGITEAAALVVAKGGPGGAGGTSGASSLGGIGGTTWGKQTQHYGANGADGQTNGAASDGSVAAKGPGGGGGGSGRNAANTTGTASVGGTGRAGRFSSITGGGGTITASASGGNGTSGVTDGSGPLTFGDGGGGGSFAPAATSDGGNGGFPGGGGGGGAASQGTVSGKGGDGGNGCVIVVVYS